MIFMMTMMLLNVDDLKICLTNAQTLLSSLHTETTVATTTTEASSSSSSSSLGLKVGDAQASDKDTKLDTKIEIKIDDDDDASTTTATTTYKSITAESHSSTKKTTTMKIYQQFLPFFDAKMKFLEDMKTSQSLTCDRMIELLIDRFMILKECISNK